MHSVDYLYLESTQNSHLFVAHYSPDKTRVRPAKASKAVILVPPFAEEMNRSKRMYVLCSRLLADAGYHVINFDYSGTGDSSGEWGQFKYQDWVDDLKNVYHYVKDFAGDIDFIALRFGVFVLADAIVAEYVKANKYVFWDPIERGEVITRQLVRMKIAATMADESKKLTTQEIMDDMGNIGFLESAGYQITHPMFEEIAKKNLVTSVSQILKQANLHWMTLGKFKEGQSKWLANSFKQGDLQSDHKDGALKMYPVNDVKFWMQQEVTISPRLLQLTHKLFTNGE